MPKLQKKSQRFFSKHAKGTGQGRTRRSRKYIGGVSFNHVFTPSTIPSQDMYPLNQYNVRPELGLSTRTMLGGKSNKKITKSGRGRRSVTKRIMSRRSRRIVGGTNDVLLGQSVNNPVIGLGTSAANQATYNNFMAGPSSVPGVPIPFLPGAPNLNLPALV